jgi:hypothetical protein
MYKLSTLNLLTNWFQINRQTLENVTAQEQEDMLGNAIQETSDLNYTKAEKSKCMANYLLMIPQFDAVGGWLAGAAGNAPCSSDESQRRDGREATSCLSECVEHDGASARELLPAAAVADVAAGTH